MHEIIYATTLASVYLMFALGLSITWGTIDVLNFAHGSIFMFSAFSVYLMLEHFDTGMGLLVMVLVGAGVGALLSGAVHLLAFEPLRRRANARDREMQMLIVGVGLSAVPVALANKITGGNPFGLRNDALKVETLHILGVPITSVQLIIMVVAFAMAVAVQQWLRSSRHGLALRAIGVDDETSSMMGVNRSRLALVTMAGAGVMAGLAGVLVSLSFGAMTPSTGDFLILKAFAVIIIGGVGSVTGVVVGAFVLAGAETLILTFTGGTWVDAMSFALIFLLLLVRPQGIFGRRAVVKT
ncbi:branched-chain amino acid ABC transporter permease [Dactylosporangium sp. NPDC005572]|uniref:branched-chain amino acid ABC transporter permease n=1 Tax=Dactylosporangium sp. NPDC005572 TaxID=3156889 RepID=UPI0033A1B88C